VGGLQHFSYFQWRFLPSASHSSVVAVRCRGVALVFALLIQDFGAGLVDQRAQVLQDRPGKVGGPGAVGAAAGIVVGHGWPHRSRMK